MFIVTICLIFAFLCSYIAGQKNRDRFGWFILGGFLTVFALIAIAAVPALDPRQVEQPDDIHLIH